MDTITELRDAIEKAAARLGASRNAVFKWRQRGIPSDWKLRLLSDADTSFTIEDLDQVDGLGTRPRAKDSVAAVTNTEAA
jgi:hypothetical protein